ncbi:cytochrome b [Stappia taiwanensis]|uniref:Cytochrome b n=1 Tax=Stappia taiwanensis TaxID=992267 RepID=A0A838XIF9_9HYPH|nr:cytochrome b/b6 domain-containing protein [Stappia taiwanensis]MBA4611149.1 cytochrome b [Stappia taiwanensis]GGE86335.1 cytochrome b [Stappia taiwanensis]
MARPSSPTAYSRTQILLHWTIAALVIYQLVFGHDIKDLGRALRDGQTPDFFQALPGNLHIWFGFAILGLTLWRLALRMTRGAPPAPEGTRASLFVMKAVYLLFYGLLIAAPVSGAIAWYLGIHDIGEIHEKVKPVFIVLIGLHVAATVWHSLIRKDDTLRRMLSARPS